MNNAVSPATDEIMERLRTLSEGLYYVSETDSPFEAVFFPASQEKEPEMAMLADWAHEPQGAKVETVALSLFFRSMIKEKRGFGAEDKNAVSRFQQLKAYLEEHLQEVKVHRVGERKITAFILGRTQAGELIGLKTSLVET